MSHLHVDSQIDLDVDLDLSIESERPSLLIRLDHQIVPFPVDMHNYIYTSGGHRFHTQERKGQ